ncbi:MAG: sigma-54-dependent Fis family transcriptional regulator [Deltaproteobacteria bacterium]|nr:sigma-54-dependent Fis family transcriptional regulator [Deltaproteobacteria bacterium]
MSARVLIADDEPSIRFVLRETLESAGHAVTDVANGDDALRALTEASFDLAFFDIRMPGASGLDLLERARTVGSDTAIVIITAQNTFENAVEAMKRGAFDYLAKPFGTQEVLALVEKALRSRALESEVRALRRALGKGAPASERLVGKSSALLDVFKTIGRVARSDVPVLVTGESGTGKELIARAIHAASSRAAAPFVAVNAAAIPRDLLESELFGHERGAFTGAVEARAGRFREASGGTLFLDEIGDMPVDLQAKLLRVLQTGEVTSVGGRRAEAVNVRILAATHRDLDAAVASGAFREDLLYRLRVVPIAVPPLRERREDIPPLIDHFLARYDAELTGGMHVISPDAIEKLVRHAWPGNVRELENAIKRALVLVAAEVIGAEDFAFLDGGGAGERTALSLEALVRAETEAALDSGAPADVHAALLSRVEKPLIEAALARTGGNQLRAAELLGINRNTLRKRIVELGIDVPDRP